MTQKSLLITEIQCLSVLLILGIFAPASLAQTDLFNQTLVLPAMLDVFSLKEPYDQVGQLKEDAKVTVVGVGASADMLRIRFNMSSNELAEAQCKRIALVQMMAATTPSTPAVLTPPIKPERVTVAFSPKGEALKLILDHLRRATTSVDLGMFLLSNDEIIDTLCYLASQRKIPVRIFADEEMNHPSRLPIMQRLSAHGVQVFIEHIPDGKMHMKSAIIDGKTVISGASNWTKNSFEENMEDTVIVESEELASRYTAFLESILQDFEPYTASTEELDITKVASLPDRVDPPHPSSATPKTLDDLPAPPSKTFQDVASVEVYFSPRDQGVERALSLVQAAQQDVDMALFFVSDKTVFDQLGQMGFKTRNVSANLLVGSDLMGPTMMSAYRDLLPTGMNIYYEKAKGLMHLKTTIADNRYVVTGSANWSTGAKEKNFEDVLVFNSPEMAAYYKQYLAEIRSYCDQITPLDAAGTYSSTYKDRLLYLDQPSAQPAFSVKARVDYLSNEKYLPAVLKLIQHAQQSIYVSLYEIALTKEPQESVESLLKALVQAARNGVYVYVVLECPVNVGKDLGDWNAHYIEYLRNEGVDAHFDTPGVTLHEKMIVVDDLRVVIGSHNWSDGSLTHGYESSVLLTLPQQDSRFANYIQDHLTIPDMSSKEVWDKEIELQRYILSLRGAERAAFIQQL